MCEFDPMRCDCHEWDDAAVKAKTPTAFAALIERVFREGRACFNPDHGLRVVDVGENVSPQEWEWFRRGWRAAIEHSQGVGGKGGLTATRYSQPEKRR